MFLYDQQQFVIYNNKATKTNIQINNNNNKTNQTIQKNKSKKTKNKKTNNNNKNEKQQDIGRHSFPFTHWNEPRSLDWVSIRYSIRVMIVYIDDTNKNKS